LFGVLFPVGFDDDLRLGTRLLRWVLGMLHLSHHLGLIPVRYGLWVSILEFFVFFTLLQTHTVKYFSEYFPKCNQTSKKKSFSLKIFYSETNGALVWKWSADLGVFGHVWEWFGGAMVVGGQTPSLSSVNESRWV
jgi:hypothetical protein